MVSQRSPLDAAEILRGEVRPQKADLRAARAHWKTGGLSRLLDGLNGHLLNFGSGDGGDRRWLEKRGFQVTSFDVYPGEFTDYVCDGHELPFAGGQFDVVTSIAVFEHLYDPFRAASEIFRVLKKGGTLVGSSAFLEPYHADSFFHMSPKGLREVLQRAGFRDIEIHPGWSFNESLNGAFWPWNRLPVVRQIARGWHRFGYQVGLSLWRAAYRLKGKTAPADLNVTFAGSLIFRAKRGS
jgi:SAM-dependent methyltransferase